MYSVFALEIPREAVITHSYGVVFIRKLISCMSWDLSFEHPATLLRNRCCDYDWVRLMLRLYAWVSARQKSFLA